MNYSGGFISLCCGTQNIIGDGTAFLANVNIGDVLCVYGLNLPFKISAVIDDTHLTLTNLIPGLAGNVMSGLSYAISTNFTPILNLPLPGGNMLDVQGMINRAWTILDKEMPSSVKGLISL